MRIYPVWSLSNVANSNYIFLEMTESRARGLNWDYICINQTDQTRPASSQYSKLCRRDRSYFLLKKILLAPWILSIYVFLWSFALFILRMHPVSKRNKYCLYTKNNRRQSSREIITKLPDILTYYTTETDAPPRTTQNRLRPGLDVLTQSFVDFLIIIHKLSRHQPANITHLTSHIPVM